MNAGSGAGPSRTFRVALAISTCGYVLAVACGMYAVSGGLPAFLQVCLWGGHGVVLALLLRRLGPTETALGAALLAVAASPRRGTWRAWPVRTSRCGSGASRSR
ncbi:hypothetical protein ACWEK2_07010 [Streptomyces albidoflavus]